MSNYELIKYAIQNKKQVTAMYEGRYREMCPHNLGTKLGRQQAMFYQFGGDSSKGPITPANAQWRCMQLDKLTHLEVKDGLWFTGDNHSRPQTCVDRIEYEVAF